MLEYDTRFACTVGVAVETPVVYLKKYLQLLHTHD